MDLGARVQGRSGPGRDSPSRVLPLMQPAHSRSPLAGYSAVVLTYRRVRSLARVIDSLLRQTQPPSLLVVVDNDPDQSAAVVARELAQTCGIAIEYTSTRENLGPAGGWALGVEAARAHPLRGDWVGVFDDDDPIDSPDALATLMATATTAAPNVAAVGLRGAKLHRWHARLVRTEPAAGCDAEVDYLASNGAPLYRWDAIAAVGFFDPVLFFGFEDLELGLRLNAAGWRCLVVAPPVPVDISGTETRTCRRRVLQVPSPSGVCRRHLGWMPVAVVVLRSVGLGSLRLHGGPVLWRVPALESAERSMLLVGAWVDGDSRDHKPAEVASTTVSGPALSRW